MTSEPNQSLRTAVYVDGYNLYYGRLRGTPFKWLDVIVLFDNILKHRDQNELLTKVHYFTAPALATFATNGQNSVEAQHAYIRALKAKHGERFYVTFGKHTYDSGGTELPTFIQGKPYDKRVRSSVWKLEEKQTDVNLAITMYRDVSKGLVDRIVLVSNDSDAEPALIAIREDFPNIMIGTISPLAPAGPNVHRRVSGSLANQSHWTKESITDAELQNAQFPQQVPTNKKPVYKPLHW